MNEGLSSFFFPQEYFGPERKGRISLDVDIEGPVLLIPKHAFSPDLMVGDIGHVKVTNSTRYTKYAFLLPPNSQESCTSFASQG